MRMIYYRQQYSVPKRREACTQRCHRSKHQRRKKRGDEDEALTSVTSDADIWMRQIAVTSERALSLSPVDSLGSVGSRNECDEPGSESIIDSSDAEHEPPSIPTQPRSSCRAVSSTRYRLPFFDTATKSVETSLTKRVAAGRKVAENNGAHEVLLEDDILDSSLSTIDNGNDECFSTGGVDADANEPDLQAAAAAAAAAARSEVASDDDYIDSPPLDDEFDGTTLRLLIPCDGQLGESQRQTYLVALLFIAKAGN